MLSGSPIDSAVRFRMMSLAEMTAETLSWMCGVNIILLVCSAIHIYWNKSEISSLSCFVDKHSTFLPFWTSGLSLVALLFSVVYVFHTIESCL
jgi:hypothetical protein